MNLPGMGAATPSLLGYGCMRFPLRPDGTVDEAQAARLIHRAVQGGVNYFDTAWPYHGGEGEPVLGRILSRYPRETYYLATKLPCWEISSREDAAERFARQLERLRTDYVDFYLLHSLSRNTWRRMKELGVVELLEEAQRRGRIRWFGFSFHDSFSAFEEILRARSWDLCQIQLNYMDTEHQAGLRGYALAEALGIPVVVMEPVKGGSLAQRLRSPAPAGSGGHSGLLGPAVGSQPAPCTGGAQRHGEYGAAGGQPAYVSGLPPPGPPGTGGRDRDGGAAPPPAEKRLHRLRLLYALSGRGGHPRQLPDLERDVHVPEPGDHPAAVGGAGPGGTARSVPPLRPVRAALPPAPPDPGPAGPGDRGCGAVPPGGAGRLRANLTVPQSHVIAS